MSAESGAGQRFRDARGEDWARLEEMLGDIERGKASLLSDEDLFELPVLYRSTLSSLSVARETSLDQDLVGYLESLSTRAYFILYGVHAPFLKRVAGFFLYDWPAAVRSMWRETIVAALLIAVGAVAGYLLVRSDPAWFYAIVPGDLGGSRDPSTSVERLREVIYGTGDELARYAVTLFVHNFAVALLCFALGFAFALPSVLFQVYNGCLLGAFLAIHIPKGLGVNFAAWLAIHGTTELFAIALAGAAGMRIGLAVAFPGRATRLSSAIAAGRAAGFVMLGVLVMLGIAGLLEGLGRQLVTDDFTRVAIGTAALVGWLVYFYASPARRERARGG